MVIMGIDWRTGSGLSSRDSRMIGPDRPRDELVERDDLSDEHDRQRIATDGELQSHEAVANQL
jgi:hypothetical protein